MSDLLLLDGVPASIVTARAGMVRPVGKAYQDDMGIFRPTGCTFFWAMQGEMHKTEKFEKHLDYLVERENRPDEIRILGEVDWRDGWDINPYDPQYEQHLGNVLDKAWKRGLRCQVTLIGGKDGDARYGIVIEKVARVVNAGRRHMVSCFEICNEWDRLDKMTFANMEKACRVLREAVGNEHLIGLSRPAPKRGEDDNSGYGAMTDAMKRCGANLFILHLRRTDYEMGWDHVSQGYDFRLSEGYPGRNNEPKGPQSSDGGENRPILIAMNKLTSIVCNGGAYVFHPGQMVTGNVDPSHGRPDNLWDVPGIEDCMNAAFNKELDSCIPDGIENYHCVNNWRDTHPFPLPKEAFWSDEHFRESGWMNKNYACVGPDGVWVAVLDGVKSRSDEDGENLVVGGVATRDAVIEIHDPLTGELIFSEKVDRGDGVLVEGRENAEAGYLVIGQYV
jgi:hypothetical protein